MKKIIMKVLGFVIVCIILLVMGFMFEIEIFNGFFDFMIIVGMGLCIELWGCNLINQGLIGYNVFFGCLVQSFGVVDQGDLNYDCGDMFINYFKGIYELLLKMFEDIIFMVCGIWICDFVVIDIIGMLLFNILESVGSNGLSDDVCDDFVFKVCLLDLWVSKGFDVGGQWVCVCLGNQVINWGESLFVVGGINNINVYDYQVLVCFGVQFKEVVLLVLMFSVVLGLGLGVNVEVYY